MALNEIYKDGNSLDYIVDERVKSGDIVFVSGYPNLLVSNIEGERQIYMPALKGVAETDAKLGADGYYHATLRHEGVFEFEVESATAQNFAAYLTGDNVASGFGNVVTLAAPPLTDNAYLVGYVVKEVPGSAGNKVRVRINN
jgi:predicted RecA/RadA family phage recombinase